MLSLAGLINEPAALTCFREHSELAVNPRRTQVGFSANMQKIRPRTSSDTGFLPTVRRTLEIARQ